LPSSSLDAGFIMAARSGFSALQTIPIIGPDYMPIPLGQAAGQKAQCHQRAEVLSRLQAPMSSTC
jgi:hypothetical protein